MDGLEGAVTASTQGNSGLWLTILGLVLTPLTGIVAWLFGTMLSTKKTADSNLVRIENLEETLKRYNDVPAQISSLKAKQNENFEEVLRSLNRLEAHMMRQQGGN